MIRDNEPGRPFMPNILRSAGSVLLTAAFAAGCGGDSGGGAPGGEFAGTVRDSAGIRLVDNTTSGVWGENAGWSTDDALRFGEAAGAAEYQFGQILGVAPLSDQRIVVLDAQAQRLQVYGPDGAYERTIGGPGNGPGEFSPQTGGLFVGRGDTILVPDLGNQRLNAIPAEGEPSNFPLRLEQGIPIAFDLGADGALVSQRRAMNFGGGEAPADPNDLILAQHFDGSVIDTLLTPKRGGTFQMRDGVPEITLFAPEPMWTMLSDGRIAYASNDAYRINVYGPGGELEQVVTFPHQRQPVTEEEQQRVRELIRSLWEEQGVPPQAMDQMMSSMSFAENWPAFTRLQGGPDGSLWVQRVRDMSTMTQDELDNWNPQLDQGSPEWDVFEADGRYAGVVELPARFTPMTITTDRIYGVFRDEFDVQYVRVLSLTVGPAPADA